MSFLFSPPCPLRRHPHDTSLFFLSGVSRRHERGADHENAFLPPTLLDACMSLSPAINLQLPGLFERRKRLDIDLCMMCIISLVISKTVTMCTIGVEGCLI